MVEEEKGSKEEKPKKSKWCLWACGGCGCLVIIVIIILFALQSFTDFNLSKLLLNEQGSKKQDEEDREMTKAELIDYFVTETTVWPGYDQPIKVSRFEKPIVMVSIADTPPEGGIKAIDDFITQFNANSSTIKLEHVESGGDIKIYFQTDTKGAAGISGPSGGNYIIDHADVKLSHDAAIFEQSLGSILSHEMLHALGFTGHYTGSECRLMSPDTCGSHLSINEERLIQMLYSTDIPVGLDAAEVRAYFQNWQPQ